MKEVQLVPYDILFSYNGMNISMKNMRKNDYTGLWTFDLNWGEGELKGVPVSGGTNVVKGNGTPFYKVVFIDFKRTNGDILDLDSTRMFLLEESDGL